MSAPGWKRLWRHSYALGLRWLVREARRGWPARRVGFARLLVPLDPRRYYELGRVAEQEFSGRCLDVSSPKLLASLLQAEGKGSWVAIDLLEAEIEAWRTIDPALELEVQDATALRFEDGSFDHCICISVVEHIGPTGDERALAEIWRVLKPDGVLHLTMDVAAAPRDVYAEESLYGNAGNRTDEGGVFFKRNYAPEEVEALLSRLPWIVRELEYTAQRRPGIERWFYEHAPWTYLTGPFLRFVCADGFVSAPTRVPVDRVGEGVVYARLQKPS